ncbi:hypothetical protein ANANG_G00148500 [Anguilla anguilla]|uniref:RRM domain-containing protein n=1 Tax=Anguilla anguilla TaxID=7936 RepID=A0A9D3M674_ANGAN|nr:hypothetical protein ANANG_G00148500 [Anguilla anguilla]
MAQYQRSRRRRARGSCTACCSSSSTPRRTSTGASLRGSASRPRLCTSRLGTRQRGEESGPVSGSAGGEQELASLRELGLTEPEMELWRSRDLPEAEGQSSGVRAAPGARRQRLQAIREKVEAREKLLSLPQRLSASRPLSRREMEIERALFHGSERLSFLSALYHQEDASQAAQGDSSSSDGMDLLYREVLRDEERATAPLSAKSAGRSPSVSRSEAESSCDQKQSPDGLRDPRGTDTQTQSSTGPDPGGCQGKHLSEETQKPAGHTPQRAKSDGAPAARHSKISVSQPIGSLGSRKISVSQPIGSLGSVARPGPGGPLTVRGTVDQIPEEEIRENKETEEGIRSIPRFQNYQRGEPSQVLCVRNLSPRASLAQLVSLFSRFQPPDGPPLLYRLLTGRLKGQAFITFSDAEQAEAALDLLNGYRLLDKPLVIEFGRERRGEEKERGKDEEKERGRDEDKERERDEEKDRGR